ncbi:hypothetical protein PTKIN_Ptkin14bG0074500 [Pterospermum kingtungense]
MHGIPVLLMTSKVGMLLGGEVGKVLEVKADANFSAFDHLELDYDKVVQLSLNHTTVVKEFGPSLRGDGVKRFGSSDVSGASRSVSVRSTNVLSSEEKPRQFGIKITADDDVSSTAPSMGSRSGKHVVDTPSSVAGIVEKDADFLENVTENIIVNSNRVDSEVLISGKKRVIHLENEFVRDVCLQDMQSEKSEHLFFGSKADER